MIKKAKEENIDNDDEGINLIKQSEKMLENVLKTYNVLAVNEKTKVPVKALVKLDTAPGTDTPANFLQAQLGLVNNVMNNIRAYKDVAWYFGDEKPADGATPVTVTGKTKTNYIRLDQNSFGQMIAESLDPVTDGPVPMSQTLRANFCNNYSWSIS